MIIEDQAFSRSYDLVLCPLPHKKTEKERKLVEERGTVPMDTEVYKGSAGL
jgi:hypothetical protein